MARIVYGVSGEGSGHSSRAREVAGHLVAGRHEVKIASYDRGYANLSGDFDVIEIEGLTIGTRDNVVSPLRTVTRNLRRVPGGWRSLRRLRRAMREFEPHVVLTDFEPLSAYLAGGLDLPLVSVDNQHRMRYMVHPVPRRLRRDALVTKAVIRMMVPRPCLSYVTTFWFGEVKNDRTRLFPPILRRAVREARPTRGEHVLVYVTKAFEPMLNALRAHPDTPFRCYGFEREGQEGHLSFRPFSLDGFLADLASSRAVIGTAGFTLITESLHLGKPYLANPMAGQFEQQLNALLLEDIGRGRNLQGPPTPEAVGDFLAAADELARGGTAAAGDPCAILQAMDELVADDAALAHEAHERRRRRRRRSA